MTKDEEAKQRLIDMQTWGSRFNRCGTCVFGQFATGDTVGLCKRRAPVLANCGSGTRGPVWPLVDENEWCGEFKRRS